MLETSETNLILSHHKLSDKRSYFGEKEGRDQPHMKRVSNINDSRDEQDHSSYNLELRTPPRMTIRQSKCASENSKQFSMRKKNMNFSPIRSLSGSVLHDNADRFIPDRSAFRVDICRATILDAEKRRRVAENDMLNLSLGENGDPNARTPIALPSSVTRVNGETLTPLQTEFRKRMRSALLSIPMDETGSLSCESNSRRNRKEKSGNLSSNQYTHGSDLNSSFESTSSTLDSTITSNNTSFASSIEGDGMLLQSQEGNSSFRGIGADLVYSSPPEADDEDPSNGVGPGNLGRLLSFKSSRSEISHLASLPNITPQRRTSYSTSIVTPSPPTSDPFSHDQLRVLHRTVSKNALNPFATASLDPLDLNDDGFRSVAKKLGRKIPTTPSRILDAPELVDDYYLNLVSWGGNNILAVALGQRVYLWNAETGDINHLLTLHGERDYVTSVAWSNMPGQKQMIAVGTNSSNVQIWDADILAPIRTLTGHSARVGSLSWNQNYLSSGGRDSLIIQHDMKAAQNIVSTFEGHTQEVCGLKWDDDATTLASGGNENYLCLWDAAMSRRRNSGGPNSRLNIRTRNETAFGPRLLLTHHKAAVKALGWCPFHRGLLASGGGTADRTIKFWNTNSGAMLNSIDTGSQVCSLLWSKHNKEICSSHGFSENQLILWKYPNMTKIQEFTGHTARVLHMEQSPDGGCVVSAAADETLRFWDVFGAPPSRKKCDTFSIGSTFPGGMLSQLR